MNESDIGQNVVPWKKEASEPAMLAASRSEDRALGDPTAGMTRGSERKLIAERFAVAHDRLSPDGADEPQMTLTFMAGPHGELRDLQAYLSGLVEGVIRSNLRQAQELFLAESPRAFLELQQQFMHDYFQAFQRGTEALIRAAKGEIPLSSNMSLEI